MSYPGDWVRRDVSPNELTLFSTTGGATAVVIKRGQAVISVGEEKQRPNLTLSQLVDEYLRNAEPLSRRLVRNEAGGSRGCHDLEEVRWRDAVVAPEDVPRESVPYYIHTAYFCAVNARTFVTLLSYYEDDNKQALYRPVALRVAESLRVDE